MLTPNSLRLITTSDRAPAGLFDIPDGPADIMDNIRQKYEAWYHIWNTEYLPLVMERQKWHNSRENLKPGDVIYFKLTESKMSANWRIGTVEATELGDDGLVRKVSVSYKDTSSDEPEDWMHRSVDRPVRNVVKLFHLEDTNLMDDIRAVHDLAEKILNKQKISFDDQNDVEPGNIDPKTEDFDDQIDVEPRDIDHKTEDIDDHVSKDKDTEDEEMIDSHNSQEEIDANYETQNDDHYVHPPPMNPPLDEKKFKKKRKTEVEKLEIQMKGWDTVEEKAWHFYYNQCRTTPFSWTSRDEILSIYHSDEPHLSPRSMIVTAHTQDNAISTDEFLSKFDDSTAGVGDKPGSGDADMGFGSDYSFKDNCDAIEENIRLFLI